MSDPAAWDEPLVRSARKWIDESLSGWAEADYAKVVTLAPIAAEHLGKAALWKRNPILLAPLDNRHQRSFLMLATEPDLNDAALRTVGLRDVLQRLPAVYGTAIPLDGTRLTRLVECRGGAVHIGQFSAEIAQHVLTDVLTIFRWIATHLQINPHVLFGVHSATADRLLDERRSQKQRSVDQRLASASMRIQQLALSVGGDLLSDIITQKEALTLAQIPRLISVISVGSKFRCPGCNQQGMLLGELETEPLVDVESGPDGPEYNVGYDYYLIPDAFYCHVCGFTVNDTEELSFASLPYEKFRLTDDEVTDELIDYARDQSAWNDFHGSE